MVCRAHRDRARVFGFSVLVSRHYASSKSSQFSGGEATPPTTSRTGSNKLGLSRVCAHCRAAADLHTQGQSMCRLHGGYTPTHTRTEAVQTAGRLQSYTHEGRVCADCTAAADLRTLGQSLCILQGGCRATHTMAEYVQTARRLQTYAH